MSAPDIYFRVTNDPRREAGRQPVGSESGRSDTERKRARLLARLAHIRENLKGDELALKEARARHAQSVALIGQEEAWTAQNAIYADETYVADFVDRVAMSAANLAHHERVYLEDFGEPAPGSVDEVLAKFRKSNAYILKRIRDDEACGWYMGAATETFELAIEAAACQLQVSVETVRAQFLPRRAANPAAGRRELLEAAERVQREHREQAWTISFGALEDLFAAIKIAKEEEE